jgi:hypothetical protein
LKLFRLNPREKERKKLLCLWADPAEALRLAQIGFWVHLPFQPVATKIGELELLALDGGGPAVAGVLAARTGGGGGEEDYDKAEM